MSKNYTKISDVSDTESGMRLDSFLACRKAYESRNIASKYCDKGYVLINGKKAEKRKKVNCGDIIEYEEYKNIDLLKPQNIPLDIRYEDEDIMIISKQPYLVCHPANQHKDNTLVNALIYHCGLENLCNVQGIGRPGIIHRLDANTSGLMIIAKTNRAAEVLILDMKNHTTSRHYLACVWGIVKQDTGKIDAPLLKVIKKRPKMVVKDAEGAKNAITTFETLKRYQFNQKTINSFKVPGVTLLDCKIHTGRTHQIRAHMEFINHPVLGDLIYSAGSPKNINTVEEFDLRRQFLHSYKLGFNHPITGKPMHFEDDLPQDLKNTLEKIKFYSCKD